MAILYPEQAKTLTEYEKAREKLRLQKEAQQQVIRRLEAGGEITRAEFNKLDGHHKMAWARSGLIIQ